VDALLGDPPRRRALVAAGSARPTALGLDHAGTDLVTVLREVGARAGGPAAAASRGAGVRPAAPPSH